MTWPASIRTWAAGEKDTATLRNQQLRDPLKAVGDAWTTWTPALTSSGSAPSPASATGGYIHAGRLVLFWFEITMSATVGTGNYTISLPTAAASYLFPSAFVNLTCFDTSATVLVPRVGFSNGTTTSFVMADNAGTRVSATSPFTWATGDVFAGHGFYEAGANP